LIGDPFGLEGMVESANSDDDDDPEFGFGEEDDNEME
jgi:hypothetical protein